MSPAVSNGFVFVVISDNCNIVDEAIVVDGAQWELAGRGDAIFCSNAAPSEVSLVPGARRYSLRLEVHCIVLVMRRG